MKSLGETLAAAREAKGYTLEYVARETNIARKFLAALEAEDFSQFPAAAYETGFLRNYGEYLGLDVQELMGMYRALKIQEQPVPMEQLLKTSSPLPKILGITLAALAVLGGAGFGVWRFVLSRPEEAPVEEAEREPETYTLDGSLLEQRLYLDDVVIFPLGDTPYKLTLKNIGDGVALETPAGRLVTELGAENKLDLDGDGQTDLIIVTGDYTRNSPKLGALLRLERIGASQAASAEAVETVAVTNAAPVTVFESSQPYPFTLQIAFQGYCMFRWEILRDANRPGRTENYYSRGQELSIQAQNGVRLWLSNAGSLRTQIIGGGQTLQLTLGAAGEVVVADLLWEREENGRYRLVLRQLDT